MKSGSIISMHAQYYVLDINDYDLMENPEQVEGIIERIGYMLEQTSHLRK